MYEILKKKTLLYIEDDSVVLDNISIILKSYFRKVYAHTSAEEGCLTFGKRKIDLILVDIELPGISGIEFIKRIREINQDIPIIVISAYTKTDYLIESIELKIEQYIVKPFTSKKLEVLLNKLNTIFTDGVQFKLTKHITINPNEATLSFEGISHNITSKELLFLTILAKNKIVTYDEIDIIWEGFTPTQEAIRSFIKQLRKKLPEDTLKNRQSIGYYVQE